MKQDNLIELYDEVYEYALYFEPNFPLPSDTTLRQLLIEQLPGVPLGTDFYVSPTGITLPINEKQDLIEPYNYSKHSYFHKENQTISHCPILQVW